MTPKSPRAAVDFTTSLHAKEAGQDSATLSKPWKSVITGSMLHRLATLLIPAVALAAPSPQAEPPASAVVDCPREWLESMTAAYVAAQRSGAGSAILSLGGYANTSSSVVNVTYTENGNVTDPATSVPAYPLKIDFTRSIHDTVTCRTFTEIIAATDPHPYVIHTRIEFSPPTSNGTEAATGGYPTVIESIVTDDGDWLFNATGTLKINAEEDWGPIVFERRDTRDVIQAVGDAYFDRFGNVSTAPPLWGAPCYRLEGGLKAAGTLEANGSCTMVWPSSIHVPYRRYVIDETLGALSMFVGFPGLDRTQGQAPMPDSHFFRVEHGVLRYLHTASACVVAGCGL